MQTEERMCRHSQQQRNSNDDMRLNAGKISNSKNKNAGCVRVTKMSIKSRQIETFH